MGPRKQARTTYFPYAATTSSACSSASSRGWTFATSNAGHRHYGAFRQSIGRGAGHEVWCIPICLKYLDPPFSRPAAGAQLRPIAQLSRHFIAAVFRSRPAEPARLYPQRPKGRRSHRQVGMEKASQVDERGKQGWAIEDEREQGRGDGAEVS